MDKSQLLLLSGMPRSGSTWMLRLLNELWVLRGGTDYNEIRTQYHLEKYLTPGSALIELSLPRLIPVLRPLNDDQSFAVKTHACPRAYRMGSISNLVIKDLDRRGQIVPIFLYRDPRDAVLSGYEFGQRGLSKGRPNRFTKMFSSIDTGIEWMGNYLNHCWDYWINFPKILTVRYEDFLGNYEEECLRIISLLGLESTDQSVSETILKYKPNEAPQIGTHFFKGQVGRFRDAFTDQQKSVSKNLFGDYLKRMHYEPD